MLQKAVLSVLVVCCGLLAKWLRVKVSVRVGVRVRAGAWGCTSCTFFSLVYKCGEHLCLHWLSILSRKCALRVTYGYSIDDVTA